jgi:predicted ATPase
MSNDMIQSISCKGYRGFATKQSLKLAVPNGKPGSGLTVLVGPNGGGKSTLVECFNKISLANRNASFSKGKRNLKAGDMVEIELTTDEGQGTLRTRKGGSETQWEGPTPPPIYYLPSRRFFNPYFTMNQWNRQTYLNNPPVFQTRTNPLDSCAHRLIDLNKGDSTQFDSMLSRIIGKSLQWTIDQEDNGSYFVKITKQHGLHHNSDGMGEGVVSLMFIVDALCGTSNELIVIDEPELSLHPQLQRRLLDEILVKTKDSQLIISTHSPNMLSLESIVNGGMVARVFESDNGTNICMIDDESRGFINSTSHNVNNPHILGTDARACFFTEDGLIITEGQEDVVLYPVIMNKLGLPCSIPFFGYGAGGASGISSITHLLHVLGFKRVGAIFDGDKKADYEKFCAEYSGCGYKAWIIPAEDIRDKKRYESPAKAGLLGEDRKTLKPEYENNLNTMFSDIQKYLER